MNWMMTAARKSGNMNSIVKGFAFNLQARKRLEDGVVGSTVWRRTVPSRYERSIQLCQPASRQVTSDRVKRAPRGLAAVTSDENEAGDRRSEITGLSCHPEKRLV